jgi:hypothetical protein
MNGIFADLGAQIEHAWSRTGYDDEAFPTICAAHFETCKPWTGFSLRETLAAVRDDPQLAGIQFQSNFGDLQVVVFRNWHFYIEILFWAQGVTSIHDHAFAGAFCMLHGESVHTQYAFRNVRPVNSRFLFGDMGVTGCENLKVGDIRRIAPGSTFIHATFHLPQPSVSLVARTYATTRYQPQLDYHPPHVALDTSNTDLAATKMLQSLQMSHLVDQPLAEAGMLRWFRDGTAEEVYWLLRSQLWMRSDAPARRDMMAAVLERPFGRDLIRTIQFGQVRDRVIELRGRCQDTGLRRLLGVLVTCPDRAALLAFFGAAAMPPVELARQLLAIHAMASPAAGGADLDEIIAWLDSGETPKIFDTSPIFRHIFLG